MSKSIAHTLFEEISSLIEKAKQNIAFYANSTIVLLYWQIGNKINCDILANKRAKYGKEIVQVLSDQLSQHYGAGFDRPNLSRMIRFANLYPDENICVKLSQQLSWSHIIKLITIDDHLKRDFYTQMCRIEQWSVRTLREKIDRMLYERTAIAKLPDATIRLELDKLQDNDRTNPDLYLQDPCIFKFLYSKSITSENDLEEAILSDLQSFIQELGSDFCFVARQKRMSTENNDRYLDLLFFHRAMRRLIAIDLKYVGFQPEHAGQMEWYLKWLNKYERRTEEESPLGIIICAEKDQEDVELLELGKNGIHVAQYLIDLPPKKILEEKLKRAISLAREKHERLMLTNQNEEALT